MSPARFTLVLGLIGTLCDADPPGAFLNRQIDVPSSMQTDTFSSPQYVNLPPGFQLSVWARLAGARFLAIAPNGDVFVSQPDTGQVSILRPNPNGGDPQQFVYVSHLSGPQGLAFSTVDGVTWLYVGEENQVDRYAYRTGDTSAPSTREVLVTNLLGADAHPYKDIAIGPDQQVYFSYGASANVNAADITTVPELAAIYVMNPDGSNLRMFASGLRNPEGVAFVPGTNTLWTAVNGRDQIPYPYKDSTNRYGQVVSSYVDNHPPDLFTNVTQGGDYGWPFCNPTEDSPSGYSNMPFDNDYDTNANGAVDCSKMTTIARGIQAHSAPLGVAFLQGTNFAAPYRNGVVLGYHGSWDRTVPTGYRVAYFPWNGTTQLPGTEMDLVTGFYGFGRPVAVAVNADGSLLVTDDLSGTVYKLIWAPSAVSAANGYPIVAPDSYAAVYGSKLAAGPASAPLPAAGGSYPTTLGGVSLSLTDSSGQPFQAQLVYVSPSQINFIVPNGVAPGTAQLMLGGSNSQNLGSPQIGAVAPALFSMSGDGNGVAAAIAVDGKGNQVPVFSCSQKGCAETPIDVSNGPVYLSLYGTGIRGAAAGSVQVGMNGALVPVQYAGAQSTYPGLDQVNVQLPASLAGAGEVQVQVGTGSAWSNPVTIRIQ